MKEKLTLNENSFVSNVDIHTSFLYKIGVSKEDEEVDVTIVDGKIVIQKIEKEPEVTELKNISYEEVVEFVLKNIEFDCNTKMCLEEELGAMGENGLLCHTFFMNEEGQHFEITSHYEILNEDTEYEEVKCSYDVKIL